MKNCTTCGQAKPLAEFNRDKRSPDERSPRCKPCTTAYARAYYQRNLKQSRAKKRAYAAENRDSLNPKAAARLREWRKANPERAHAHSVESGRKLRETHPDYFRDWYQANIESERQRSRQVMRTLRRDRPELERATKRRYRKKHAAAIRVREREKTYARRARQSHSTELAEFMAALVLKPCAYCGSTENITVDHVVPLSRGGAHEAENLAPACLPCNASKCGRLLSEWEGRLTGFPK